MVLSADGIDTTVIFEAGSTSNSTNVLFNISDDEVALEPLESYDAALQSTTSVRLGSPGVTRVNTLDDDRSTQNNYTCMLVCREFILL